MSPWLLAYSTAGILIAPHVTRAGSLRLVEFTHDIAIVGAGAAGLTAAIFAGQSAKAQGLRIVALEGARKPGAKILVSGGGRCNVTNDVMDERFFFGGSRTLIRNVLRAWGRDDTLRWFAEMGVTLKLEPTGKYFPVTDSARTVLNALLDSTRDAGVELRCGVRVSSIEPMPYPDTPNSPVGTGFRIQCNDGTVVSCRRAIIAAGGLSLPKSGSDGAVLQLMKRLGHRIVPTTPALAPLVLGDEPAAASSPSGSALKALSGLTTEAHVVALDSRQRIIASRVQSLLFTHFGLSGPAAMDISRHLARPRAESSGPYGMLRVGHPDFARREDAEKYVVEAIRKNARRSAAAILSECWPARLAEAIAPPQCANLSQLSKESRRHLVDALHGFPVPVTGDRGFAFAETTAGGVDLSQVDIRTMESRVLPGLHLCGEILDVDGCIGGYNFQWAWATGMLAGRGTVHSL